MKQTHKHTNIQNGGASYANENRCVIIPEEDVDDEIIEHTREDISTIRSYPAYVIEWGPHEITAVVWCPSYNENEASIDWRDGLTQAGWADGPLESWFREFLDRYCDAHDLTVQDIDEDLDELIAAKEDLGRAILEECDAVPRTQYYPDEMVDQAIADAGSIHEFICMVARGIKKDWDADREWADELVDEFKDTYNFDE